MNNYVAIQEFSMPQNGVLVHIGDIVGKVITRSSVYINLTEYSDHAAFDWVGTVNSAPFLTYVGVVPDPPYAGVAQGRVAISSGALTVTVSQAFGFLPTTVVATVTKPDDSGMNIFATVELDSITTTGFVVDLSAAPGSSGYFLDFLAK